MTNKNVFFLILLFISNISMAQKNEYGVFIGGTGYYGDIGHNEIGGVLLHQSVAIGLINKINFHDYLSFRSSVQVGKLKADDSLSKHKNIQSRNLSFESNILDVNIGFEFNFQRFMIRKRRIVYSPYVFAGLAFFSFNPTAENSYGQIVELQNLGTEGQDSPANNKNKYNLNSIAIPFGIGYKANIGEKLALGIEWIWRATQTDYIDDVSGYYVNSSYLSDESAEMSNPSEINVIEGKTRGNPNNNDWYNFTGLTISYKIKNKPKKCPKELLP